MSPLIASEVNSLLLLHLVLTHTFRPTQDYGTMVLPKKVFTCSNNAFMAGINSLQALNTPPK